MCGGLREAGPQLAAILATTLDGTEAKSQANLVLAKLGVLHAEFQKATEAAGAHEAYDIGDDDGHSVAWSESHETGDHNSAAAAAWKPEGFGRYQRGQGSGSVGAGAGGAAPTETPPRAASASRGAQNGAGVEPPGKHRKGQLPTDSAEAEASVLDARRAMNIHQEQNALVAAGVSSPSSQQLAGQQHARRVEDIVNKACAKGIQPLTAEGQELHFLLPEELKQWATANLGEDVYW